MKKLSRILSLVMLMAMLLSIMSTGAFALVDGDDSGSSGGITIGASQRPSNDSAYTGDKNEDGDDTSTTTVAPTGKTSAARVASEKAATYQGKQDDYAGLTDSELDLVKDEDNMAFLTYVRDYVNDNPTLSDEMTAVVETAVTIFGDEAIYGPDETTASYNAAEDEESEEDSDTSSAELEAQLAAKQAELAELEAAAYAAQDACIAYQNEFNADASLAEDADAQAKLDELTNAMNAAWDAYDACAAEVDALADKLGEVSNTVTDTPSYQSVVSKVTNRWKEVCPTSNYSSFAAAIQHREDMYFEQTMDIINSTDYNITIDLNLSNIYVSGDAETAFYIDGTADNLDHDATISFTRGTIYGDGFYVVDGVLNLGGLINAITYPDITVYAETANAITVNGEYAWAIVSEGATLYGPDSVKDGNIAGTIGIWRGNVYVNGGKVYAENFAAITNYDGNLIIEGSSYIDSANNVGLYLANDGCTSIEDGSVRGITGIAVDGTHTLDISGGHVIGDLGSHMTIAQGGDISGNWGLCGNAIVVRNSNADSKDGNPAVSVYANNVLLSENNLAIMCVNADGSARLDKGEVEDCANVSLISENCIEQEYIAKTGDYSDYNKAVVTVTINDFTTGYASLADAFDAAANADASDKEIVVKLLGDYTMDAADAGAVLEAKNGNTVVFDGNYHKLTAADTSTDDSYDGITVGAGSTRIQNVTIKDTHADAAGILVDDKNADCEIGDNVSIQHFRYGLRVTDGDVLVTDMSVDDASEIGIQCEGGETTVVMCKINCDIPVYADSVDNLLINGGWFLYEIPEDETLAKQAAYKVATYVDSKISHVEYVKSDKYYEVLLNDTPVVQVVSGETGYDTDGTPYLIYDKSDIEKIIFSVSPEVMTIEAVNAYTGVYKPIFNAPAGKSGNVAVQDSAMIDLPAGKYDLRFTFKTSNYVIKNKLTLYVYPAVSMLLDQALDYNSTDNIVTYYNVGNMQNIAVYMSELPEKIGIGSDPTGENITYLENYIKDNPDTWQLNYVKSSSSSIVDSFGQNYTYIISYADLNNLATGQNYVFLRYGDDAYCAVERLPLMVYNASVYITPTAATWSGISSTLNFTVSPNVVEIYVDDDYVDPGYYTYNTSTGALSIKGSYFAALANGDHVMEIITSNGKVSATVHTGPAIAPKTVDYHVYGGASSLSFVASDLIDYDLGITIGSANAVNVDSFVIKDSNTQFTLSANYLNRLALGTYTISAYVRTTDDSGNEVYQKCSTTFRIISASQAAYNPGTGDSFNPVLWIAILVLSAVVIVVIILPKLKKSKSAAAAAGEVVETAAKAVEEHTEKKE